MARGGGLPGNVEAPPAYAPVKLGSVVEVGMHTTGQHSLVPRPLPVFFFFFFMWRGDEATFEQRHTELELMSVYLMLSQVQT